MKSDASFFGHPRGLATLFFTEMWERFSYYGMRAFLILFMTAPLASGGLGFDTGQAGAVYGLYTGMVYLASLPGGWLADRIIGQRHATLAGGLTIMCGHVSLAVPSLPTFYLGLTLLVIGTGLLKPNISALVGQLYAPDDRRRDAGFSIYYMGINLGAFLAPLVCGWLALGAGFRIWLANWGLDPTLAWHFGFGMAAIGMAAGLIHYVAGRRHLGNAGLPPAADAARAAWAGLRAPLAWTAAVALIMTTLVASGVLAFSAQGLANLFGLVLLAITVVFFGWLFTSSAWTADEHRRLVLILILFLGATAFWSLFEQGGSTLTLFADRNTDRTVLGFEFPASWLLSLNPIFIIGGLAPAFAWLWVRLGPREPSSPAKFTLGLAFMGLGYLVMVAAAFEAQRGVLVSPLWLVTMFLLHTIGEMCLSPVGLSAMTRLAPARIAGLTMGVWFLAASIGSYIGGRVGGLYDTLTLPQIFGALTVFALIATVLMGCAVKPLRRSLEHSPGT